MNAVLSGLFFLAALLVPLSVIPARLFASTAQQCASCPRHAPEDLMALSASLSAAQSSPPILCGRRGASIASIAASHRSGEQRSLWSGFRLLTLYQSLLEAT